MKKFHSANVLTSTVNLTEKRWLEIRRRGIGGSDIGAIAGVSPYKTPISIYLDKSEFVPPTVGRSAQWGKWMEDSIARDAAVRMGLKIRRVNAILQHPEHPWMLSNVDRLIYRPFTAIHEIKLVVSRGRCQDLRQSMEDGEIKAFPEHECQVRWYMAVTGIDTAIITYELAYGQPIDVTIRRDVDIENTLIDIGKSFWQLVVNKTPPAMDGSFDADSYLQARFPDTTKDIFQLDAAASFLVDQYHRSSEIIDQHEKVKAMARQNLELAMGSHEIAVDSNGRRLSWKPQTANRLDITRLKADHPNLCAAYSVEKTSRVFRVNRKNPS